METHCRVWTCHLAMVALDTGIGLVKTIQVTPSEKSGVVKEPCTSTS